MSNIEKGPSLAAPPEESPKENVEATNKEAEIIREIQTRELPQEIIERARSQYEGEELEEHLHEISEAREEMGLQTVVGFHTSDKDIPGECLQGDVHYSRSLNNLYAGKSPDYLYVVQGTGNDEPVDESLNWYHSRGAKVRVLHKTRLTPELQEKLGASLAKCKYNTTGR